MTQPQRPMEYEVWREKYQIIEWRDGAVFRTVKVEQGWYDIGEVETNQPRKTNYLFAPGGPDAPLVGIRRKDGNPV